jgi:mevalonate kinase
VTETEEFLVQHFRNIIDESELPQSIKDMLNSREPYTLDELDESYNELIHFLQHKDYYTLLERIEKNEKWLAEQTDATTIARGRAQLNNVLAVQLNGLMPKGEAI